MVPWKQSEPGNSFVRLSINHSTAVRGMCLQCPWVSLGSSGLSRLLLSMLSPCVPCSLHSHWRVWEQSGSFQALCPQTWIGSAFLEAFLPCAGLMQSLTWENDFATPSPVRVETEGNRADSVTPLLHKSPFVLLLGMLPHPTISGL